MNFSAWSVHKPTPSILLFFMLTVAGLIAFGGLHIQRMPDMDFPTITVAANLPGATPTQIETEVAHPLEDSIASVGAVRHISTTINDGTARLRVEFEFGKSLQEAQTDVRDAVTRIRANLPSELQEPIIGRVSSSGEPLVTYAVSGAGMDAVDLSWFVDNTVSKALLTVRGVAQIRRQGGVDREITVELDPLRLQALELSAAEISRQLQAAQGESPGGRAAYGGQEQAVRSIASVSSAAALGAVEIPTLDGRRLRLDEIAEIRDEPSERRQQALLNGQPVVSFQVMRTRGYDEITMFEALDSVVKQIERQHPRIRFTEITNAVDHVRVEYTAAMRVLYEGCILAVVVVWLFLRDWRATLVSAVALPLSIIPTFLVLSLLGYSLSITTLLALTLVVGILVDDAIVEVENIMRHLQGGKTPMLAALDAAQEIGLAVIATSLTLVAVFLPTAFVSGITGELFRQFGWTIASAVLFSLLVARLLTPMMAAYLLQPKHAVEKDGWIMVRYLVAVRWCLEHPKITTIAATLFFITSLSLVLALPTGYMPPPDAPTMSLTLEGPPGSTLEETVARSERARTILQEVPGVGSVFATIGAGVSTIGPFAATSAGEVRTAQLIVRRLDWPETETSLEQMYAAIRGHLKEVPGARVSMGAGLPGERMSLILTGEDPAVLEKTALAIAGELRTLPGIGTVSTTASLLRPEVTIRPDFSRAAELGITEQAIGEAVRVASIGDYDFRLPRLNLPDRQIYVRVRMDSAARANPDTLAQMLIPGSSGVVPLTNVAEISVQSGPTQIDRYDRRRSVSVHVELRGQPIGELMKAAEQLPSLKNLPPGVQRLTAGDAELLEQMMSGFMLAMLAGIFCVYAVMVLLFHDFGQPFTVLAALPLAAGGALGMLALFDYSLSMASLIGLLMLVGIVAKNSILLVEYAIMARRDLRMSRIDALIDACHKRARPIVMTTMAMTAGMLPIALDLHGDSSFRGPMAVAVIGGLMTSTVLSLLVVPVVFELVDEFKLSLQRRLSGQASPFGSQAHDQ